MYSGLNDISLSPISALLPTTTPDDPISQRSDHPLSLFVALSQGRAGQRRRRSVEGERDAFHGHACRHMNEQGPFVWSSQDGLSAAGSPVGANGGGSTSSHESLCTSI